MDYFLHSSTHRTNQNFEMNIWLYDLWFVDGFM